MDILSRMLGRPRWLRLAQIVVASAVVAAGVPATASVASADDPDPFSEEFSFTGAAQSWEVPADVHEVDVELWGAQGGGVSGGPGGYVRAHLSVSPGDTLQVNVGGAGGMAITGGWNGGGEGGPGPTGLAPGSGGGGGTDIRMGGTSPTNRVAAAGGGGGAGANARLTIGTAGAGGGTEGTGGVIGSIWYSYSGYGATTWLGSTAGIGQQAWYAGAAGGGGGGGWRGGGEGGGGDAVGSGGGGSGGVDGTNASLVQQAVGERVGDGFARITYPPTKPSTGSASPGTTTFSHTGAVQYWTVPAGVTTLQVETWGAQGGGDFGGLGGYVQSKIAVSPGELLAVIVGSQGDNDGTSPFGEGGAGGYNSTPSLSGYAGGGASDVRIGGLRPVDRVAIGGGGGGAAAGATALYGQGGVGGGDNGGSGSAGAISWAFGGAPGGYSGPLGNGHGGNGYCGGGCGGGGGGGYFGGWAGAEYYWSTVSGGGGGGSGYTEPSRGRTTDRQAGVRPGDGTVRLSWPGLGTGAPTPAPSATTDVFSYTGGPQYWQVPDGVNGVEVELWGAQGGGTFGGLGGYTKANIPVTPGQMIQVNVGGAGSDTNGAPGWNGGGIGLESSSTFAGGGGGASDVRADGTMLENRTLVAGGGGGQAVGSNSSYGSGGDGGGVDGDSGSLGDSGLLVLRPGGSQTTGAGFGQGASTGYCDLNCPGAGGGGWWGGYHGDMYHYATISSGGSGGSGYIAPWATGEISSGVRSGNGRVEIHSPSPLPPESAFGGDAFGDTVASVQVGSGNVVESVDDGRIQVVGPTLQLTRTYNSLDTKSGPLGVGWTLSFEASLDEDPGTGAVTATLPSGRRDVFRKYGVDYRSPAGNGTRLFKDSGVGWRIVDPDGATTTFDTSGKLIEISDKYGREQTYTYSGSQLTSVSDATSNRSFSFTWSSGRITEVRSSSVTRGGTTGQLLWRYGYDGTGRLAKVCDPRYPTTTGEKCTTYTYGAGDRLTKIVQPDGNDRLEVSYNGDGTAAWTENGENNRTTFLYGGAATRVTDPDSRNWTFAFDGAYRTTRLIDPEGDTTIYRYDNNGFRSEVFDPNGNPTRTTNDARGNPLAVTDANGNITRSDYDANGFLVATRDARSTSPTDTSYQTTYINNAQGDPTAITSPPTGEYPSGVARTNTYTAGTENHGWGTVPAGLLATSSDGDATTTFHYDSNGDLRERVEPTGSTVEADFDQLGIKVAERVIGDSVTAETLYTYDMSGNETRRIEPAATNVVTSETHRRQIDTTFDPNRRATSIVESDVGGSVSPDATRTTQQAYDNADRLVSVTDPEGGVTSRTYDGAGNVATVTDAEGRVIETAYDSKNQPTTVTLTNHVDDPIGGSTPRSVTLSTRTYDPAGRLVSETTPGPGAGTGPEHTDPDTTARVTKRYAYDRADRLISTVIPKFSDRAGNPVSVTVDARVYDAAGNTTRITGGPREFRTVVVGMLYAACMSVMPDMCASYGVR